MTLVVSFKSLLRHTVVVVLSETCLAEEGAGIESRGSCLGRHVAQLTTVRRPRADQILGDER